MSKKTHPSSFVSYSWDGSTHKKWVAGLATRLREDGVDATLDTWATVPGDQLPEFMETAIRNNDFVLIICTPRYKRRAEERHGGVGYEGHIMTAEMVTERNHRKFIPVLREGTWEEAAPSWIRGKRYVDLSDDPYSEEAYHELLNTLLGLHETPPPIGSGRRHASQTAKVFQSARAPETTRAQRIRIVRIATADVTSPRRDGTRGSDLYDVPLILSERPTIAWRRLFLHNWKSVVYNMYRKVAISHDRLIVIGTTMQEVKRYHADRLRSAVDTTNEQYKEFLEAQQRKERQDRAREEAHRQHIEDVAKNIRFD